MVATVLLLVSRLISFMFTLTHRFVTIAEVTELSSILSFVMDGSGYFSGKSNFHKSFGLLGKRNLNLGIEGLASGSR